MCLKKRHRKKRHRKNRHRKKRHRKKRHPYLKIVNKKNSSKSPFHILISNYFYILIKNDR